MPRIRESRKTRIASRSCGAADEVELAALVEQLVGIDAARAEVVALHRVVLEHDRLAAEDRGLDLRQAVGDVVAAGGAGDSERDGVLLGGGQRARPAPRDLLKREPERLGVGEFAIQELERRPQSGQLRVGELDRRQMEVLRRQRVGLLLDLAVDRLLDRQHDPERLELRAIRVEAACERVLVHHAVPLDVAPDLVRGHGPTLRHQVRDQRQLADQLLGVLRHPAITVVARRGAGGHPRARSLFAGIWAAPRTSRLCGLRPGYAASAVSARSCEIGAPAQSLVVARPLLPGRQLLLDPVEAPEAAAEVVDHVDERRLAGARDDRAPVLERAVVTEDDVQHRLRDLGGNPSSRSIARRTK